MSPLVGRFPARLIVQSIPRPALRNVLFTRTAAFIRLWRSPFAEYCRCLYGKQAEARKQNQLCGFQRTENCNAELRGVQKHRRAKRACENAYNSRRATEYDGKEDTRAKVK